jgi:uncharacterized protein
MAEKNKEISLFIVLTHNCNFHCRYCEICSHFCKVCKGNCVMTGETINKIEELLKRSEKDFKKISLSFFGGEPLLHFDKMKKLVDRVRKSKNSNKYEIYLYTNGYLLDKKKIEYLKKNKVQVSLSFDGREKTQNLNRPLKENNGETYKTVLENIKTLRSGNKIFSDVNLYMTSFPSLAKDLFEDFKHMLRLGFRRFELVPAVSGRGSWDWNEEQLKVFEKELEKIKKLAVRLHKAGINLIFQEVSEIKNPERYFENFGQNIFSIDSNGSVYSSPYYLVLTEPHRGKYRIGHVTTAKNIKDDFLGKKDLLNSGDLFKLYYINKGNNLRSMVICNKKLCEIRKLIKYT